MDGEAWWALVHGVTKSRTWLSDFTFTHCLRKRPKRHRSHGWIGKTPWRRECNPLQCSCLGNPKDRGAWGAAVHGVTESRHDWAAERGTATRLTVSSSDGRNPWAGCTGLRWFQTYLLWLIHLFMTKTTQNKPNKKLLFGVKLPSEWELCQDGW